MSGASRQRSSTWRSEAALANLHAALAGRETVREVAELLGREGIAVLPLKGALLHALGCTDPLARPMVDVDLLLRREQFERAVATLAGAGWALRARGRAGATVGKPGRYLGLDLHHRLYAHARFGPDVASVFRRARPDRDAFGAEVLAMHPLDLYAHLVGHFAKERLDHRQASRLVDLERVAARCELDLRRTAAHLEDQGLGRAARYTLAIARDSGDTFAARVLERLGPDPVGDVLARLARRAVAGRPQPWKPAAVPVALLDRSLLAGAVALADHARDALARWRRG